MDPISSIVAAVVVGGATKVGDVAGTAVKDVYSLLKVLLKRRLSDAREPEVASALESGAAQGKAVRSAIDRSGAASDPEIL
jgi:hypothetical protein